jgi:hypothetical protein
VVAGQGDREPEAGNVAVTAARLALAVVMWIIAATAEWIADKVAP